MFNRVLTICPTFRRKTECLEMMDSFYYTQVCSDIIFLTMPGSITDLMNSLSGKLDYEYYHITNDDCIYHTPGWDEIFISILEQKGPGIVYGDDSISKGRMCTFPFISRELIDVVGWIQLPGLNHLCGDLAWWHIGRNTNKIHYVPSVNIEHKTYLNGKAHFGKYKKTNSDENFKKDNATFRRWRDEKSKEVIERVKLALS